MARKTKLLVSKSLYQLGIASLVASVFWVGMTIYQALKDPANINVEKEMLEPISAKMDEETIDKLSKRIVVTEQQVQTLKTELETQAKRDEVGLANEPQNESQAVVIEDSVETTGSGLLSQP